MIMYLMIGVYNTKTEPEFTIKAHKNEFSEIFGYASPLVILVLLLNKKAFFREGMSLLPTFYPYS